MVLVYIKLTSAPCCDAVHGLEHKQYRLAPYQPVHVRLALHWSFAYYCLTAVHPVGIVGAVVSTIIVDANVIGHFADSFPDVS